MISIPSFEPVYTYQNKYFFKTLYNDTVYRVNGEKIIPSYYINLGEYKLPEEKRIEILGPQLETNSFRTNYSKYCFSSALECGGKIFLKTVNWGTHEALYFVINKNEIIGNSETRNSGVKTGFILNDWDGGIDFWPRGIVSDIMLFMPIDAYKLKKLPEFRKLVKSHINFPEKEKQLEDLTLKSDVSDNPIIMVVTLKPEI